MDNLLGIIKSMNEYGEDAPGKKSIQKMIYLIQEAGIPLGYDYNIHFYGPYSAELDLDLRYLTGSGSLDMNITKTKHEFTVVEDNISSPSPEIQTIINQYIAKTPSDLELLATTLYVQRALQDVNLDNIVSGVTKIKGSKYSVNQISHAFGELSKSGYFHSQNTQ